jgi:hypothetical protein
VLDIIDVNGTFMTTWFGVTGLAKVGRCILFIKENVLNKASIIVQVILHTMFSFAIERDTKKCKVD